MEARDAELEAKYGLRTFPGYFGVHTRDEAPGAMRNGTRVIKVLDEKGDATRSGMTGIVLGSIASAEVGIGYFVEWDNRAQYAVFVIAKKIAAAPAARPRTAYHLFVRPPLKPWRYNEAFGDRDTAYGERREALDSGVYRGVRVIVGPDHPDWISNKLAELNA